MKKKRKRKRKKKKIKKNVESMKRKNRQSGMVLN